MRFSNLSQSSEILRIVEAEAAVEALGDGRFEGRFLGCRLSSVFQPIFDLTEGGCYGHEAYVRSVAAQQGGIDTLSPWVLFSRAADDRRLVLLDRLCRLIHTLNFFQSGLMDSGAARLFLNVHGRLLLAVKADHGRTFRQILDQLQIQPRQIVLEIPEVPPAEWSMLAAALASFRKQGFLVSLTLSRHQSLADLVAVATPDFVKLDARPLQEAAAAQTLIATAARVGSLVVFGRVEDPLRLALLRDSGAALAQGHYLGRPLPLGLPLLAQPQVSGGRG